MTIKSFIYSCLMATAALTMTSCGDDFLDKSPSDKYADGNMFKDINGAQKVLAGAYEWFTQGNKVDPTDKANYTIHYMWFMPDLMGEDAMVNSVSNYNRFLNEYKYALIPSDTHSAGMWMSCYCLIDNCNSILDHIKDLPESSERNRIEGEAHCLRAYTYHFLVRLYGKPVDTNPDSPGVVLRSSSSLRDTPRSTVKDCYNLMVDDVEKACQLLKGTSSTLKCFIGEKAAHAIAARIYLDLKDYDKGSAHAREALKGCTLMSKDDYKLQFCENNTETIWSFTCTATDNQKAMSLPSFWWVCDNDSTYLKTNYYCSLGVTHEFIEQFDDNDVRKQLFVTIHGKYFQRNGSYVTSKICHRRNNDCTGERGSGTLNISQGEYNMLRGSEMYLILAELAADAGKDAEAQDALNEVRKARGLERCQLTGEALKDAILTERRKELFAEGHRFFDLKRRHKPVDRRGIEENWSGVDYIEANSNRMEMPIPQVEIDANGALTEKDQNPYYHYR